MLLKPLVLVFAPEHTDIAQIGGLNISGFEYRHFPNQHALYAQVRDLADVRGIAVMLVGTPAENRNMAFYLRTTHAALGLIVQLRTGSEEEQMSLIQAGVDWMCPVGASRDLVATMLLSLWNRRRPISPDCDSVTVRRCGGWALTGYAWMLEDPDGARVSLTSSERALLMTLFDAPDLSATHDDLIAAINRARDLAPGTGPRTRLGVLVSRLRSKCRHNGMDLPIRVMHNLGYMFAAQVSMPELDNEPSHSPKFTSPEISSVF